MTIKIPTSPIHIEPKLVISGCIFLNLLICLILGANLNLSSDEAYAFHTTGSNLKYAFDQAINFELQPPLYFIMLWGWRSLKSSIFFARLLSIIFITITLTILPKISRRFLPEINPVWLVIFLAFNPFVIWAALEIRVYAFVLLLSALLLLFFFDGYLAEIPQHRARWWYILVAILALYTQYYLGFFLVANACALLVLRRWQTLRDYVIAMVPVGVCFSPMLWFFLSHKQTEQLVYAHTHTNTVEIISLSDVFKLISRRILGLILRPEWIGFEQRDSIGFYLIFGIAVIAIGWQTIRFRRQITSPDLAIAVITVVLILFFVPTLYVVGQYGVLSRHVTLILLPLTLLVFSVLKVSILPAFPRLEKKQVIIVVIVLVLISHLSSLYVTYANMAKLGDQVRIAAYLQAQEKPGQLIVVFNEFIALSLGYQYTGINPLVTLPQELTFEKYDMHQYALEDEGQIVNALAKFPPDRRTSIWLVKTNTCAYANIDFHCEILNNFVNKNYQIEIQQEFYGATVELLHRKSKN